MQDRFMFRVPFFNNDDKFIGYEYCDMINGIKAYNAGTCHKGDIQLSTGLKDRNGKVIYEGDIVKLSGNDNPYMNNIIGVVKYSQEYAIFFINIPNNIAWYEFCEVNKKELKIIGNTYQNPELLKEK